MESWDKVKFQFCNGMVHFFEAFWIPIYSSLSKLFSLGNGALGFGQFSELAMHGLDCVGGVNYPPNVSWIFEVDRQIGPFFTP